jgi:hypothetical protein
VIVTPRRRTVTLILVLALGWPAIVAAQHPTPATAAPVAAAAAGHPPVPVPPPPKPAGDGHAATPAAAAPPTAASTRRHSQTSDLKDAVARIQKRLDEEVGNGNKSAHAPSSSTRATGTGARGVPSRTSPRIALTWRTSLVWPEELAAAKDSAPHAIERITLVWK